MIRPIYFNIKFISLRGDSHWRGRFWTFLKKILFENAKSFFNSVFTFSHYGDVVARGSIVFTKKIDLLIFLDLHVSKVGIQKKWILGVDMSVCLSVSCISRKLLGRFGPYFGFSSFLIVARDVFFYFLNMSFFRVATIQKKCRKTQFYRFSQFSRKRRYKSFSFFTR